MADSYTRQSTFADGDVISAEHGNKEFNQLVKAFHAINGHNHDGTQQGGASITDIADRDRTQTLGIRTTGVVGSVVDTDNTLAADDDGKLVSQKAIKAYVDQAELDAVSTSGLAADSKIQAKIVDEDTMISNAADKVPTQQSVKAYVDTSISSSEANSLLTMNSQIQANMIDEDDMISDTASKVPTQQSVKSYVDSALSGAIGGGAGGLLSTNNNWTGTNTYGDNVRVRFGTSNHAFLHHNGTDFITNVVSGKHYRYAQGNIYEYINGGLQGYWFNGGLLMADNKTLRLGSGSDTKVYHDGSHSFIDQETGNLYIRALASGNDIVLQAEKANGDRHTAAVMEGNGDHVRFRAFYDGAEKLATDANGINITTDLSLSGKRALADFGDWMWVNPDDGFTGGVYFNNSTVKTNGALQVGAGDGDVFNCSDTAFTYKGNNVIHDGLASESNVANTVVKRNSSGDVFCRLVRSTYSNQTSMSGAMAFRVNNGSDNYIRFCSDKLAIRDYLRVAESSSHTGFNNNDGENLDTMVSAGTYRVHLPSGGLPSGYTNGDADVILKVNMISDLNYIVQEIYDVRSHRQYTRKRIGSTTWSGWVPSGPTFKYTGSGSNIVGDSLYSSSEIFQHINTNSTITLPATPKAGDTFTIHKVRQGGTMTINAGHNMFEDSTWAGGTSHTISKRCTLSFIFDSSNWILSVR